LLPLENINVPVYYKKLFGLIGANLNEIKFGQVAPLILRDAMKRKYVNDIMNDFTISGFQFALKQTHDEMKNILLEKEMLLTKKQNGNPVNGIENKSLAQIYSFNRFQKRPLQMKRFANSENSRTMGVLTK
jgi:hypothetical protein